MKKSFAICFGFLLLGMLDSVLSYTMPVDVTYQSVSILWHFTFIAMIVFVRDKPYLTRILVGLLIGILFDYLFNDSFPFCTLMYPFMAYTSGIIMKISHTNGATFGLCLVLCFVIDFLPYIWQSMTGTLQVGFLQWFYCMEAFTLVINIFIIALIIYVDVAMMRFFLIQENLARREQRKVLKRAKLSKDVSAR